MYKIFRINADSVIDFAAIELKKYLRMMMPRCGEIKVEFCPDAKDGFRLGLMSDFGIDPEVEDTNLDDVIYVDANEKGGIIAGSNARSVLLAVYIEGSGHVADIIRVRTCCLELRNSP